MNKRKRYYELLGKKIKVSKSNRKGKQAKARVLGGKTYHFGDKKMPEYPGTKRGDRYCARTISLNKNNKINPNTLSRKLLWNCVGKKSKDTLKEARVKVISKKQSRF